MTSSEPSNGHLGLPGNGGSPPRKTGSRGTVGKLLWVEQVRLLREDPWAQDTGWEEPCPLGPPCRRHSSAASWVAGPTAPGPRLQSLANASHW